MPDGNGKYGTASDRIPSKVVKTSPVEPTASTGTRETDNTRWQSSKTIYDPCHPGYRVPDGGSEGVWSKAFGSSEDFPAYENKNGGFDLGTSGDCYPSSGLL